MCCKLRLHLAGPEVNEFHQHGSVITGGFEERGSDRSLGPFPVGGCGPWRLQASACGTAAPRLWTPARLTVQEAMGSSDLGAHHPGGCCRFLRGQPQIPAKAETESDRLTGLQLGNHIPRENRICTAYDRNKNRYAFKRRNIQKTKRP